MNSLLILNELLNVRVISMQLASCHGSIIERLVGVKHISSRVVPLPIQSHIYSTFSEALCLFVLLQ